MRALAIASAQLRTAVLVKLAYRFEVVLEAVLAAMSVGIGILPLAVALRAGRSASGWTFDEALCVLATFTVLRGLYEALIAPSILSLVESVRQGTLDFLLLKPADAQLLASTARFEPFRLLDVAVGAGLYAVAFARLGKSPTALGLALFALLLGASFVLLYAISIGVASLAFWVVRLDNLAYLFSSLFDFARWPRGVFRGVWRVLFTFVLPIGLMTSVPAEALLGWVTAEGALLLAGVAAAFLAGARLFWSRALRSYTSASS